MRYTPNGKKEKGRITASGWPISLTALISRKIGSTSAVLGTSMTIRVRPSSARRPRNSVNARAYPAGMLVTTVIASAAAQ